MVMLALGCGGSDTGSGGGGGCSEDAATCDIDAQSTVCGDRITVVCDAGGSPEAEGQCEKGLEESGEVIYCCDNAADVRGEGAGAAPPGGDIGGGAGLGGS